MKSREDENSAKNSALENSWGRALPPGALGAGRTHFRCGAVNTILHFGNTREGIMPDQVALMKKRLMVHRIDEMSWLDGVMYCAEFAGMLANTDEERALADRLLENALDARAEVHIDMLTGDIEPCP